MFPLYLSYRSDPIEWCGSPVALMIFGSLRLIEQSRALCFFRTEPRAVVDGDRYDCLVGNWAFWLPQAELKFLHARNGFVHCIHRTAPSRDQLFGPDHEAGDNDSTFGVYTREDWKTVFSKTTARRTAENFIAAMRLHRAGLGPKPRGICVAKSFIHTTEDKAGTAGLVIEDARRLPTRQPASEQDVIEAGVVPDKIKSCVRQQVNGYVVDLNSCVGVMPVDADEQVRSLDEWITQQVQMSRGA